MAAQLAARRGAPVEPRPFPCRVRTENPEYRSETDFARTVPGGFHGSRHVGSEDAPPPARSRSQVGPVIPNLEVTYLTDPEVVAEVLPQPLEAPPAAATCTSASATSTSVHGDFVHRERVGWFGVDAMWNGKTGEYPLLIPIDLEPALAISREKFGEPKKLADIELARDGDHVRGSITRQGVTFVEIIGDVAEKLPTPEPAENTQFWFKFLPAAVGTGLDAGPFLVTLDQVRRHESRERIDGKLELRDLPGCPVIDLPILETVSIFWSVRSAENTYTFHGRSAIPTTSHVASPFSTGSPVPGSEDSRHERQVPRHLVGLSRGSARRAVPPVRRPQVPRHLRRVRSPPPRTCATRRMGSSEDRDEVGRRVA